MLPRPSYRLPKMTGPNGGGAVRAWAAGRAVSA